MEAGSGGGCFQAGLFGEPVEVAADTA